MCTMYFSFRQGHLHQCECFLEVFENTIYCRAGASITFRIQRKQYAWPAYYILRQALRIRLPLLRLVTDDIKYLLDASTLRNMCSPARLLYCFSCRRTAGVLYSGASHVFTNGRTEFNNNSAGISGGERSWDVRQDRTGSGSRTTVTPQPRNRIEQL